MEEGGEESPRTEEFLREDISQQPFSYRDNTEFELFKEKVRLLEEEIDKLNLTPKQIEKLDAREEEARKENLTEEQLVKKILTKTQRSRVKLIKNRLHQLHHEKQRLAKLLHPPGRPSTRTRIKSKAGRLPKTRSSNSFRKEKYSTSNLSKEQLTIIKALNKQISKLNYKKWQLLEMAGNSQESLGKIEHTKSQVEQIAFIKELINDLKITKEQLLSNQISNTQINRLNVLIQHISKIKVKHHISKWTKQNNEDEHEGITIKFSQHEGSSNTESDEADQNKKHDTLRIRHAHYEDVPEIQELCKGNTQAMFDANNIEHLLGSSCLSIVGIDSEGKILAFMAVKDYPNVPYLPRVGWEQWMLRMYLTSEFTAPNSRFLHLLAWKREGVGDGFLAQLMKKVFTHDPFVDYCLLILPHQQQISPPYSTVFEHYLEKRDLENEFRSVKKGRLSLEAYTLGLYVAHRDRFGPTITIRKTHKVHNEEVMKNLRIMAPFLLEVFGKKFYKSLVSKRKNKNYKRMTITGECHRGGKKGIGIMTLTKNIDKKVMEEYYDTFSYHGFRKMTKKDTWYKILLRKEAIDKTNILKSETKLFPVHYCYNENLKIQENTNNSLQTIESMERQIKNAISCRKKPSVKCLEEKIALEEEILNSGNCSFGKCNEMTEEGKWMDMELRLGRSRGMPFTPEEINEIRKKKANNIQTFNNSSASSMDSQQIEEIKEFIGDYLGSATRKCTKEKPLEENEKPVDEDGKGDDLKLEENPYRNMYKALWEINGKQKMMRPSLQSQVEYHGKNTAMAIEIFIPSLYEHPVCCRRYLERAFEAWKWADYCLLSVPPHQAELPFLHYFQKVPSRNKTFGFRDLYVGHRHGILGRHSVREGERQDFEEILSMSWRDARATQIHLDVLSILLEETSPPSYLETQPDSPFSYFNGNFKDYNSRTRCYVLLAGPILAGYAVVEPNYEMEFYRCHYKMDRFLTEACHRVDGHGFVRHLFIAPLFRHLSRFFLRGIMKYCDWTTLVALSLHPRLHQSYPEFSMAQGLEEWIQVGPRILPGYSERWLGTRTPGWGKGWTSSPPAALHLITYPASARRKKLLTSRIVVVGAGDAALSFLEHLIFSTSNEHLGFRYITVISEGGLPLKYPHSYEDPIKSMIPDTSGRYDQEYLDKLLLETWITSLYGLVTFIDRENNLIHLDNKEKIHYDYLFLFCGTQFLRPIGNLEARNKPLILDDAHEAQKEGRELPANVFVVNNQIQAYEALNKLATCFILLGRDSGSQVIVYGNCVEAYTCVGALLDFGVPGERITLVMNPQELCKSSMYIRCPEIKEGMLRTLKQLKVTVYEGYTLRLQWEEKIIFDDKYITEVKFGSITNKIIVKAVAMFSYFSRSVSHRSFLICQSAGLAYNKQLIIDTNFLTSADNVYAGGPFTRYSSWIQTEAFNHEYYNSVEIGAEIAKVFLERKVGEIRKSQYLSKKKDLVLFSYPLIMSGKVPGGWNYLRITKPGVEDVLSSQKALKSKLLQTGDANKKEGPGFFQLMIDEHGLVTDITCYTCAEIDVKNLIHIYGKHECLLNNLLYKFRGKQIGDLFAYFREPWAYAIYHHSFPILLQTIDLLFLEKLPYEEASFFDIVAYALDVESWEKLSDSDKKLVDDLFNEFPNLKKAIDGKVEKFLEDNENILTTYLTKKRLEDYQYGMKISRVGEDLKAESWMRGVYEHAPKHIIPHVRRRREMEGRPVEMEQAPMDREPGGRTQVKTTISDNKHDNSSLEETQDSFICDESLESVSMKGASSEDPYISAVDMEDDVEVTVQPLRRRNLEFLSMAIEEIEFEDAIRRKVNEFEKKIAQESKEKEDC